jgi:hypothetical protein
MAKKKQAKKHNFKHTAPVVSAEPKAVLTESSPAKAAAKTATVALPANHFIGRDLMRVVVLASSLVLLEVILWQLFDHTGLGSSIYGLIHV